MAATASEKNVQARPRSAPQSNERAAATSDAHRYLSNGTRISDLQVEYLKEHVYYFDVSATGWYDQVLVTKAVAENPECTISLTARKDRPPGFLFDTTAKVRKFLPRSAVHNDHEVPAKTVPSIEYSITLSRYTEPCLRPGRWYFTVSGSTFLQTSPYSLSISMRPISECTHYNDDLFIESVCENQRRLTMWSNFSSDALLKALDPPAWSDDVGNGACPKHKLMLPDFNWYWKTDWTVDRDHPCDKEGWQYAFSFSSPSWEDSCSATKFVRRKRWIRIRAIKSHELKENTMHEEEERNEELDSLIDEFEILECKPRKRKIVKPKAAASEMQMQGESSSSNVTAPSIDISQQSTTNENTSQEEKRGNPRESYCEISEEESPQHSISQLPADYVDRPPAGNLTVDSETEIENTKRNQPDQSGSETSSTCNRLSSQEIDFAPALEVRTHLDTEDNSKRHSYLDLNLSQIFQHIQGMKTGVIKSQSNITSPQLLQEIKFSEEKEEQSTNEDEPSDSEFFDAATEDDNRPLTADPSMETAEISPYPTIDSFLSSPSKESTILLTSEPFHSSQNYELYEDEYCERARENQLNALASKQLDTIEESTTPPGHLETDEQSVSALPTSSEIDDINQPKDTLFQIPKNIARSFDDSEQNEDSTNENLNASISLAQLGQVTDPFTVDMMFEAVSDDSDDEK